VHAVDPTTLSMLVGAGLAVGPALVAFVLGRASGRVAERRRLGEPVKPICSCEHGYGAHEDGRSCRQQVKRASKWGGDGDVKRYEWVECACRGYDGPEPLSSIAGWRPPELMP
jgi:hypothetical protein